jgi:hypothetical protein
MLAPHSDIPSMVTPQFGTPYDNPVGNLLQHILNTTVATFHTAGISLPEKQYISVGTPPIDCEQLVVTWESLQRGLPRTTGGASEVLIVEGPMCAAPRTLSARIHLSRC